MLICDNCNVCVTKRTFCSDKCRVAFHRSGTKISKEEIQVAKDALEKNVPRIPTTEEQEEILKELDEVPVPQEPPQPELPPFCEANKFCKSRSYGKYRIVTDNGENESIKNLCSTHVGHAKREASVFEEVEKYAL